MQTSPNVHGGRPNDTASTAKPATTAPPAGPMEKAQATLHAASRFSLANIVRGRIAESLIILLFGPEGVGKSTLGANAPNPIFICAEDGTAALDIARMPEIRAWQDVFDAIAVLANEPHDFKTLVIDTIDALEPLCWAHCCRKATTSKKAIETIEDFGYGKGYVAALDEWRRLMAALNNLRKTRGMWVILLAHAQLKTFKNPEGDDYDRWQLKLNDKAGGFLKERSDAVLFARYDTYTYKEDPEAKGKAKTVAGAASRSIYTVRTAAYDAKNRHSLPEKLAMSWDDLYAAIQAHQPASPEKLRAEIATHTAALAKAPVEIFNPSAFAVALDKAGNDGSALAILLDRLKSKVQTYFEAKTSIEVTPQAAPASSAPAESPAAQASASNQEGK